jgi:hypothetical protein
MQLSPEKRVTALLAMVKLPPPLQLTFPSVTACEGTWLSVEIVITSNKMETIERRM